MSASSGRFLRSEFRAPRPAETAAVSSPARSVLPALWLLRRLRRCSSCLCLPGAGVPVSRKFREHLGQSAILGVLAFGMTIVIIGGGSNVVTGGIDLSLAANMGLSAAIYAALVQTEFGDAVAVAAALGSGAAIGAVNAFSVVSLRILPLLATLAVMNIAAGLELVITQNTVIPADTSFLSLSVEQRRKRCDDPCFRALGGRGHSHRGRALYADRPEALCRWRISRGRPRSPVYASIGWSLAAMWRAACADPRSSVAFVREHDRIRRHAAFYCRHRSSRRRVLSQARADDRRHASQHSFRRLADQWVSAARRLELLGQRRSRRLILLVVAATSVLRPQGNGHDRSAALERRRGRVADRLVRYSAITTLIAVMIVFSAAIPTFRDTPEFEERSCRITLRSSLSSLLE